VALERRVEGPERAVDFGFDPDMGDVDVGQRVVGLDPRLRRYATRAERPADGSAGGRDAEEIGGGLRLEAQLAVHEGRGDVARPQQRHQQRRLIEGVAAPVEQGAERALLQPVGGLEGDAVVDVLVDAVRVVAEGAGERGDLRVRGVGVGTRRGGPGRDGRGQVCACPARPRRPFSQNPRGLDRRHRRGDLHLRRRQPLLCGRVRRADHAGQRGECRQQQRAKAADHPGSRGDAVH
jgi:hypothetical protein